jgi:uncharacterized protein YqeY
MTLLEKLQADVKQAMLARDEVARDTLRMLVAAVKKHELEGGKTITDELVNDVLLTASKTRQESIDQFSKAGRMDLVAKETAELEVVRRYLPRQLNEDETRSVVQRLISELKLSSKKDLGQLMKAAMATYKGQIDGKLVQKIAGELLA